MLTWYILTQIGKSFFFLEGWGRRNNPLLTEKGEKIESRGLHCPVTWHRFVCHLFQWRVYSSRWQSVASLCEMWLGSILATHTWVWYTLMTSYWLACEEPVWSPLPPNLGLCSFTRHSPSRAHVCELTAFQSETKHDSRGEGEDEARS